MAMVRTGPIFLSPKSDLVTLGIYLAKEASISASFANYASQAFQWPNSAYAIQQCMTLAEVVNQPSQFVYEFGTHGGNYSTVARSTLVVGATEWVIWYVS